MFVSILKKLAGVAVWGLAIVGLLVVVLVWRLFSGDSKILGESPPLAAVAAPLPAVVVVPAVQQSVESCDCAAGAVCTGPRGGKYCTTAAGVKRYL